MKKMTLIMVLLAIIILGVLYSTKRTPVKNGTDLVPVSDLGNKPVNDEIPAIKIPDGWKKYEDTKLGISFAVPDDFSIDKSGDYSVLATSPTTDPRFFYVSVVPENLFDDNSGEIYNYQSTFIKKLLEIGEGEIKNLSENEGQKDWYNYERNGDEIVNGNTAKVFVNQRPWEFPGGTWEYRYIFELPNKIVLAGAYFEGGPSDATFTLPEFQTIMSTLTVN